MTRKMKVDGDDKEDEGGRDEVLEFRSRLECGFMWCRPAPLSSAAKIEQETSETGETGGIETGHNSETTKMWCCPLQPFSSDTSELNQRDQRNQWMKNKQNQWKLVRFPNCQ